MSFLKDRINKRQQTHEKGYVSFTEEDLNEAKVNNQANAEAYSLLDAAMTTSSHLTEEDKKGETVLIDDVYPCTEAECDEMDALLDKAEKAAKDPNDSFFKERLAELRDIVAWSREKHWTFQWSLIGGCILSIFGFMWLRSDAKSDAAVQEKQLQQVQNWTKQDTTVAYAVCPDDWRVEPLESANAHKAARLANTKYSINLAQSRIASYQACLDTCTNKDLKKTYKEWIKDNEKKVEKYQAKYEEINKMKFKEYQKMILKEEKADTKDANKHAAWMWIFLVYVIILIPAYIYYSHQYGYNITRHRTEAKVLGGIQKVGFAIASFFLGAGMAMALLPDMEVEYSDGHTETEGNASNIAILALKLFMIFIGLCIFAAVSVFIMTYVTVMAIKRQYDWSKVTAVATAASQKAMDKVKESGIADKAIEAAKNIADKATEAAKGAADKVQEKIQEKKQEKENK